MFISLYMKRQLIHFVKVLMAHQPVWVAGHVRSMTELLPAIVLPD